MFHSIPQILSLSSTLSRIYRHPLRLIGIFRPITTYYGVYWNTNPLWLFLYGELIILLKSCRHRTSDFCAHVCLPFDDSPFWHLIQMTNSLLYTSMPLPFVSLDTTYQPGRLPLGCSGGGNGFRHRPKRSASMKILTLHGYEVAWWVPECPSARALSVFTKAEEWLIEIKIECKHFKWTNKATDTVDGALESVSRNSQKSNYS